MSLRLYSSINIPLLYLSLCMSFHVCASVYIVVFTWVGWCTFLETCLPESCSPSQIDHFSSLAFLGYLSIYLSISLSDDASCLGWALLLTMAWTHPPVNYPISIATRVPHEYTCIYPGSISWIWMNADSSLWLTVPRVYSLKLFHL